jgi:uncharacterized protein YuzE
MEKVTQLFYDTEADVLYLSIGAPRPAVSQEVGNDVLLRVDTQTGEVVGLTVMNLSSRFASVQSPQSLPVEMDLHKLG